MSLTIAPVTFLPGLWRSFQPITTPVAQTSLLQAQVYAVAQSQAMKNPPDGANFFGGTLRWAAPVMLTLTASDGSNVWAARNYSAADGGLSVTDPLAAPWPSNGSWVVATPPANVITSDAYVALFTPAEQAAVIAAAQANPAIAADLAMCVQAGVLDLTQPEVTGGMAALVAAGCVSQANAALILSGQKSQ